MAPYSWSLTRPAGLSFNELTRKHASLYSRI
jgi:hypothetical protein